MAQTPKESLNSLASQVSLMHAVFSSFPREYVSQSSQKPSEVSFWEVVHADRSFMQEVWERLARKLVSQAVQKPVKESFYVVVHWSLSLIQVLPVSSARLYSSHCLHVPSSIRI